MHSDCSRCGVVQFWVTLWVSRYLYGAERTKLKSMVRKQHHNPHEKEIGVGKPKIRKKQDESSDGSWNNESKTSNDEGEAMFSVTYDPLQLPDQSSLERDLEDMLMERALRFYDEKLVRTDELCYLVGLEDKSTMSQDKMLFTMEESLAELSELAGAAGLTVIGSTYQRMAKPDIQYYIGAGKTADIRRAMAKNKCTCVIIDAELSPSQQKNLEISFNQRVMGDLERTR